MKTVKFTDKEEFVNFAHGFFWNGKTNYLYCETEDFYNTFYNEGLWDGSGWYLEGYPRVLDFDIDNGNWSYDNTNYILENL
jgi:hypothetical protein